MYVTNEFILHKKIKTKTTNMKSEWIIYMFLGPKSMHKSVEETDSYLHEGGALVTSQRKSHKSRKHHHPKSHCSQLLSGTKLRIVRCYQGPWIAAIDQLHRSDSSIGQSVSSIDRPSIGSIDRPSSSHRCRRPRRALSQASRTLLLVLAFWKLV